MIHIGSSKGGYSAIFYGFQIPQSVVIAGAPQYFLAQYLDDDARRPNLEFLLHGDFSESSRRELDYKLSNLIKTSSIRPDKIYLHYSNKEHTFDEHIKHLLLDLNEVHINLEEDIDSYPTHSGVADAYPKYLTKILKQILDENPTHI